jgi:hypothetical protein
MEGSVLSFLKVEWKVSDTGSAHWTSSYEDPLMTLSAVWRHLFHEVILTAMWHYLPFLFNFEVVIMYKNVYEYMHLTSNCAI